MYEKLFEPSRIPRNREEFSSLIDHTVLKPTDNLERIIEAVEETERYGFRALVIPPWAVSEIRGITRARLATVVSFPHGNDKVEVKKAQVEKALNDGADEVDVVVNIMAVKSGRKKLVEDEAESIIGTAHERGVRVKYIVETGALTSEELSWLVQLLVEKKADYIKTCTGFGPRGVSIDDIVMIKRLIGREAGIKASGGIRRGLQALLLIGYGADILGTSSSIRLLESFEESLKVLGLM